MIKMIRFIHQRCAALAAVLLLLSVGGCGDGGVASHPVKGRVTFLDKPLADGTLTFHPAQGRPKSVSLAADGTYSMELPPGEYRVTAAVGVKLPPGWRDGDPVPQQSMSLPPVYGSRVRTPITVTVAADQTEPVDLKLN